jgi:hypothetical protein
VKESPSATYRRQGWVPVISTSMVWAACGRPRTILHPTRPDAANGMSPGALQYHLIK